MTIDIGENLMEVMEVVGCLFIALSIVGIVLVCYIKHKMDKADKLMEDRWGKL